MPSLLGLILGKPKWATRIGSPPPPDALEAIIATLRRQGARVAAQRERVLAHLAQLVDPAAARQGKAAAAASAAVLCLPEVLEAVADALAPEANPSQAAVEAGAAFAIHLAAASPAAAAALAGTHMVDRMAALLEAPSTQISPDAKMDVLAFFRAAASRKPIRDAMVEFGAAAAVVSTLKGANEVEDWILAEGAAWAMEIMAGFSRRLTRDFGEAGGVEAALRLLQAAGQQLPEARELPPEEEVAAAAHTALHALTVLTADNRANRALLLHAGGAAELAAVFQGERLGGWELREAAAGLLQDLAAALPQDGATEEEVAATVPEPAAPSQQQLPAVPEDAQRRQQQQGLGAADGDGGWRSVVVPALVSVLQQSRGRDLLASKEEAARVLGKYAANGPSCAAAACEAGALPPLLQLLQHGVSAAAGERRTAIAALQALQPMVGEAACQQMLAGACMSASGQLDLLGQLRRLLLAATSSPGLNLINYSTAAGSAIDGGQEVAAGWHAAAVAAQLCKGHVGLQDAVVHRDLLAPLAAFIQAPVEAAAREAAEQEASRAARERVASLYGAAAAAAAFVPAAAAAADRKPMELMMPIKCEVAFLLRSLSMRSAHHSALRACPGLLPYLESLLQPRALSWPELKATAKRILQNLGVLPDVDRPLLTYTPQQLGALLREQGVEPSSFVEQGLTGSDFVRLSDGDLRRLVAPGQQGRVLRILRAYDAFAEIDGCGSRSGTIGLAKLVTYLSNRGFRQAEVVQLAESVMQEVDGDRDDAASFPDFLQGYDEFLARTMTDLQPPSKRRRGDSHLA